MNWLINNIRHQMKLKRDADIFMNSLNNQYCSACDKIVNGYCNYICCPAKLVFDKKEQNQMTREEAVRKTDIHFVNALEALGLLKFDENTKPYKLCGHSNPHKNVNVNVEQWPEGLVLWNNGVIVWKEWEGVVLNKRPVAWRVGKAYFASENDAKAYAAPSGKIEALYS